MPISLAGIRYATQGVERGGDDAFALAIYAHVQSFLLHDLEKGKEIAERAIAAGPSSAMAWTMASATSGFLGDGAYRRAPGGAGRAALAARRSLVLA